MIPNFFKSFMLAALVLCAAPLATAEPVIQQFGYDSPDDGNRITGFILQERKTSKEAPIALLLHGLTGSSLHWLAEDNFTNGDKVTAALLKRGYRIVALDARAHGARKKLPSPIKRVKAARAGDPNAYKAMIMGTVADYRFLLEKILGKFPESKKLLLVGYSMGAQMSTILAASENKVTHLVTMVPPAVHNVPDVAPVTFAPHVSVPWLLLTAEKDQFATAEQNTELKDAAAGPVTNISFESGHLLPAAYVNAIETWLDAELP